MLSVTDTKIGDENISVFEDLGYDYIELPLAQIMALTESDFSGLTQRIKTGGLPLETCNNFFPAAIRLTGEDAKPEDAQEYAKRACERAAQMGAKIIVLGSSGAKNIPGDFPYDRAKSQLTELLYAIDDIAAPLDITVTLEPLNTKESNFIINANEGLAIAREVNRSHVKLLIDYYHMRMENEDVSIICKAGQDLRHTHIAAKNGRGFPKPGDGEDYAEFFTALKIAGYDARVSIEGFSQDFHADAQSALALLRPLTR